MTHVQKRLAVLVGVLLTLTSFKVFTELYISYQRSTIQTNVCIYDRILEVVLPVTRFFRYSPEIKHIFTAIDGVLIDISIIFTGAVMILKAHTASAIPSLVFFFGIRSIALNIVSFPNSEEYIFESPGIPSYFVFYGKVNDLYFSGHTGTILILLLDSFAHKQKIRSIFFSIFLIYTLFILITEHIHYLNDIIIGIIAGALVFLTVYRHRYYITLKSLNFQCKISEVVNRLISSPIRMKGVKSSDENFERIKVHEISVLNSHSQL